MKNVTISLDDAVVHDARVAAASEGKSLSRFVSEVLAEHLTKSSRRRAIRDFLDGPLWDLTDENGKLPTRKDIYAEREDELLRRHERAALRQGSKDPGEEGDRG